MMATEFNRISDDLQEKSPFAVLLLCTRTSQNKANLSPKQQIAFQKMTHEGAIKTSEDL